MEPEELSAMLKRFYVEAKNVQHSRNTMKAIRYGQVRFLRGSPHRKPFPLFGTERSNRQTMLFMLP